MTKTFYRTYRPKKFGELVGQKLIRLTLEQSIKEKRVSHAYLFTGPRGTGKTTTARIFAKAVNCLTPLGERPQAEPCNKCASCIAVSLNKTLDLIEIDAASFTGVENIRQLTENINLAPAELRYRIFIIDEVHMLSKGAFNALLKTLEEPPEHTIFILATTEIHKVPLTIASRCQRFSFQLLSLVEILKKLSRIAKKEEIKIDKESLEMIGEAAHGGMRDAESLFTQIVSLAGKNIKSEETKGILGITGRDQEMKLLAALLNKDINKALANFENFLKEGIDIFLFSHRLLDYLRKILFLKINSYGAKIMKNEISESQIASLDNLAKSISMPELIDLMAKIVHSQPAIKISSFPSLPLELAIVEWGLKDSNQWPAISGQHKDISESEKDVPIPSVGSDLSKVESVEKAKKEIKSKEPTKSSFVDLKAVLAKWTKVLQNVRELQPALFSLLKVCSPVKIEDDTLIISTPFKFHKDKLTDGKNRTMFCQELNKEVGIKRICVIQDTALTKTKVNDDEMLDQVKNLLQ